MIPDDGRNEFYRDVFPDNFAWSSATAAYQIEGAWNEGGKGVNIWDTFSHAAGHVLAGDTGDVACDSYHKLSEDIELIKQLGTTEYRFSLSWSRLLPDGTTKVVNPAGLAYYNRLIDGLLGAGVAPVVTLYHWDLPQALQDIGGWVNEELVARFNDYARVCFENFGDRVKRWITFNEPLCTTWLGHGIGVHAPGVKDPVGSTFKVAHTIIKAHATAWRTYDKDFRAAQKGQVGITYNVDWSEPKDPNETEDVEACERMTQFKLGWFANAIFGNGDYPAIMKAQLGKKAKQLGLPESPLPQFTEEEKRFNRGTWDFFGLNYYTTRIVSKLSTPEPPTSEAALMDACAETDPTWKRGASDWLYVVPWGLRGIINWVKYNYGNPPIYITENGTSDNSGTLDDQHRVDYYRSHINEVLKAIRLDDCNVIGYTAWSLIDNFEWAMGYSERFGLHHVDYTDPERKRTPKASAAFYSKVIKDNGFP
jgi:lactase-phlorizin hydrolase